ncbi:TPR repeat protein [Nonlabens dokdonensis DSW-6]|uniref:TPR repeat protein n=1 Tax=Nonlabens dokdonensis (strain DSM 17205 / KCTC 12402 / DSW-6) TaxID=592029 RepID=L7WET8_NONDD|nr:TPR repeat protein [Nonlabens dokdonensis DSW-6]
MLLLFLSIITVSCNQTTDKNGQENADIVTVQKDYNSYLNKDNSALIATLKSDIDSLEKIIAVNNTGVLDLGRLSSKLNLLYDLKGDVNHLNRSVEMQEAVVKNMYIEPEKSKYALAQAYIKQHRFKKADSLMRSFAADASTKESQLLFFDIAMELGDYTRAEKMLNAIQNQKNYNYLIRAAKWNDYKGDLDATIRLMEEAKTLADQSGNPSIQIWSNSNIADYYGHDGQIQNSYDHYIKTLELDPDNTYALKGIAWIAYSHEKNPEEALRILKKLKERHPLPDYDLDIAEIKEFQNKSEDADSLRKNFLAEVENDAYGAMYNTYKIEQLLSGNEADKAKALEIAKIEIDNRSTPETQSLLSYAMLKNNLTKEALENQKKYVIDKTYEPVAQLHSLEILLANDEKNKALTYTEELSAASYELGPVTMKNYYEILEEI